MSFFDDRVKNVLEEMEKLEGGHGIDYVPKGAPCGLCGRRVYGDLHLVPLEDSGSTFLCSKCLQAERKKQMEKTLEWEDEKTELLEKSVKDQKRVAEDAFLKSYKGIYLEKRKNGRIIHLRRRPLEVPVQLETGCWRFLEKHKRFLKRRGLHPLKIQTILLNIAYFLDRYNRALKYGLKLPQLDVEEQISTSLIYTGVYNSPRTLLTLGGLKNFKRFYKILPELIGYGVFPYERCFLRPSEVMRLALWNFSTIYIVTLYSTDYLLKRLILQGGEYYHKGIVLAGFYRQLLKKKLKIKQLNVPTADAFLQAVGGVSRGQFFNVSNQFNLLKGEEPFEEIYMDVWLLKSLRKDEVRKILEEV